MLGCLSFWLAAVWVDSSSANSAQVTDATLGGAENFLSLTMRQTERFKQVLKPITFKRTQSQNTKSVSYVSFWILFPQEFQDFFALLNLIFIEFQIYIGWRYTRLGETELLNRVIDSLP